MVGFSDAMVRDFWSLELAEERMLFWREEDCQLHGLDDFERGTC